MLCSAIGGAVELTASLGRHLGRNRRRSTADSGRRSAYTTLTAPSSRIGQAAKDLRRHQHPLLHTARWLDRVRTMPRLPQPDRNVARELGGSTVSGLVVSRSGSAMGAAICPLSFAPGCREFESHRSPHVKRQVRSVDGLMSRSQEGQQFGVDDLLPYRASECPGPLRPLRGPSLRSGPAPQLLGTAVPRAPLQEHAPALARFAVDIQDDTRVVRCEWLDSRS